jgi:hypothetical protein
MRFGLILPVLSGKQHPVPRLYRRTGRLTAQRRKLVTQDQ